MAPTTSSSTVAVGGLVKRYLGYNNYYYGNSRWYDWGRWVVVGACIFIFLVVLLSCTCLARRRRRRGTKPMYGTGWMAPTGGKFGVNQQHEMNNYQQGYQPNYYQGQQQGGYDYSQQQPQGGYYNSPPTYGQAQQNTGTTFNPNDGYYGQQQYGVQQPPNAYQRDGNFSPPPGPPPGK